ncbi:Integrase catalytic domain-containing protein, partial [Aphis craccivora]
MVDDSDKKETERMERRKARATLKRSGVIASIKLVHAMASRVGTEPNLIPEFLLNADGLDLLWSQFETEDATVLDCLVNLGTPEEYSADQQGELRVLINATKAVANAHRPIRKETDYECNSSKASAGIDAAPVPTYSRLPEIPLPKFAGDFHMWPTFRDRFTALVDVRTNLSNIDKLYYLMGCLQGTALEAICGIPATHANYSLAWSTLSARFYRPRVVATSLIDKLLNAPSSSQESLQDLTTVLSTFEESISLLSALDIPDLGSFMLFSLAFRTLPLGTRKLFESTVLNDADYPSVDNLLRFIRGRITVFENVGDSRKPGAQSKSLPAAAPLVRNHLTKGHPVALVAAKPSGASPASCLCCSGSHSLSTCPQLRSWSVDDRNRWAHDHRLCFNCLSSSHWLRACQSKSRCHTCSKKHHSLLHGATRPQKDEGEDSAGGTSLCASAGSAPLNAVPTVLLGTALVHVRDRSGTWQTVRAIVDSASQISAMTVSCSTRLGLRLRRWTLPVSGLSGTPVVEVKGVVDCQIRPRFAPEPLLSVQTWVLPSITSDMPRYSVSADIKDRYSTLALADPQFHVSSPVDMLLGADVFSSILDGRQVKFDTSLPTAFSSIFGWVLIGPLPPDVVCHLHTLPVSLTTSIETLMAKFWVTEEPEAAPSSFTADGWCEQQFRTEHKRLPSGRFVVPLPTRLPVSKMSFPGSRAVALKRFESLERKLQCNEDLRVAYCDFMSEYLALGHMSISTSPGQYVIPHHAVCTKSDVGFKIRVVFDASAVTHDGTSLNSCLYQGPKLQQDIVDILTRFRVHPLVFTSDICKMYRQVLVAPEYRPLQHILWRASPHDQLVEYELNTVTYGMNCAPFLALRVLAAIADEDCIGHDAVRNALLQQTYVDDICVGADSIDDVLALQRDLMSVLSKSGLDLKKWSSNCPAVLDVVPVSARVTGPLPFDPSDACGVKVLGLQWQPAEDSFGCALQLDMPPVFTKRGVLSLIARIFDPLGLFSPATFYAKKIMQRTWFGKCGWDDPLPREIEQEWVKFVESLSCLLPIRIPRYFHTRSNAPCLLLGFCDASQHGCAAVVYLRVLDCNNETSISLVGSKTKLAPVKTLSIPRLELNAALLLARWLHRLKCVLDPQLNITGIHAWTDSSIVLSWLVNRHESFKVFVSNRVHQINTLLPGCSWSHVPSANNPADCASRGVLPSELPLLDLYWSGPDFLRRDSSEWPVGGVVLPLQDLPEVKLVSFAVNVGPPVTEWFDGFSSFERLIRVVARIYRFLHRCRNRVPVPRPVFLTRHELDAALRSLVRESQRKHLSQVLHELTHNLRLSSKPVARLSPFVDPEGIIRVGGRLRHSLLTYDCKHPILLAKVSHLALLQCRRWHRISCHAGPRVVSAMVSRQFWIMSLRSVIHQVGNECAVCVRFDHQPPQPLMADLPSARVQQCRPFARVGIDFAGPLQLQETRLRKSRLYKVYIAVFVCFTVKATHLEVVTELSTAAFLA